MDSRLYPFGQDGEGLPAERILTLSDITLIVLCCMLALNMLIVPLLDFQRVVEIDLPDVEQGVAATTGESDGSDPVLAAHLFNSAAVDFESRVALHLNGRPVTLDQLPHRLSQVTSPSAQSVRLHGDSTLTAQDIVVLLAAVGEAGLDLPRGVQIRVEEEQSNHGS